MKRMAAISDADRKEFQDEFRELATETGVEGVPRLVALFRKRKGDFADLTTMNAIAREALVTKASKQILEFPRESTAYFVISGYWVKAWHSCSFFL